MIIMPTTPLRNTHVTAIHYAQHFSSQECDRIIASAKERAWQPGGVGRQGGIAVVPETRSCLEQRLPVDERGGFPLSKLSAEVGAINDGLWHFELNGFVIDDLPYLMRYGVGERDHYEWHTDMGRAYSASRKLGFSLQLTDGDDYEGGDLEFQHVPFDRAEIRKKGALVVFPTFYLHRVAPVTRGTRDVVVGWIHGPSFR